MTVATNTDKTTLTSLLFEQDYGVEDGPNPPRRETDQHGLRIGVGRGSLVGTLLSPVKNVATSLKVAAAKLTVQFLGTLGVIIGSGLASLLPGNDARMVEYINKNMLYWQGKCLKDIENYYKEDLSQIKDGWETFKHDFWGIGFVASPVGAIAAIQAAGTTLDCALTVANVATGNWVHHYISRLRTIYPANQPPERPEYYIDNERAKARRDSQRSYSSYIYRGARPDASMRPGRDHSQYYTHWDHYDSAIDNIDEAFGGKDKTMKNSSLSQLIAHIRKVHGPNADKMLLDVLREVAKDPRARKNAEKFTIRWLTPAVVEAYRQVTTELSADPTRQATLSNLAQEGLVVDLVRQEFEHGCTRLGIEPPPGSVMATVGRAANEAVKRGAAARAPTALATQQQPQPATANVQPAAAPQGHIQPQQNMSIQPPRRS